ncbi:glycosyltransferase family 87 protein [Corynebacterium yudongzhengii]|uniref:glycosyltransferase family 87 protein n=1 Tax=Corynebacterium yudongzhengii TaxID=2080740 RepID=UPI0018EEBC7B|nr:glycosyltransferase family 87 protein [Corynebacterium yudongzhengii]
MDTPVDRLFAARAPLSGPWLKDRTGTHGNALLNAIAWPLSVLLVLYTVFVLAVNGAVTDDFTTVYSAVRRFLDGAPVYDEVYHYVDPHYLYNPGATLLLTPMGLSEHFALSRMVFIIVNAAAIVAALVALVRAFGHRLSSALLPVAIAVAFSTEAVRNTLIFTNINGILLLVFVGFLLTWLAGYRWVAGLLLGVAIVIKPMFLPLLFLPLVRLDVRTIGAAVAVPVVTNLLAWPLMADAWAYVDKVMPYLSITRDYANASLPGLAVYFDLPTPLYVLAWGAMAVLCGVGTLALLPWRRSDELLWATTTSALLLTGVFLLSSLGQQYYSLMLFPFMFTVLLRVSALHSMPAWIALVLVLAPLSFTTNYAPVAGRWIGTFIATAGWALLITVICVTALAWLKHSGIIGRRHMFTRVGPEERGNHD